MLNKLRKHLNLLFITSVSALLFLLIIFVIIFNIRQLQLTNEKSFLTLFYTVQSKIQTDNIISDAWLSSLEQEHQLYIQINDNGNMIQCSQETSSDTYQLIQTLTTKLDELANRNNISLTSLNAFDDYQQTDTYTIKDNSGRSYYTCAAISPVNEKFRSIYLFQRKQPLISTKQIIFYLLVFILGFFCIFVLSRFMIKKAISPVECSYQQQQQFIAAASHELRTPLTVIRANNSDCKCANDASQREIIEHECSRMSRLISDLLVLSNIDAGNYDCITEKVNCDTLLVELYESFFPIANKKKISLDMDLPDYELPIISSDKQRLEQLVSILLDNAISYSPENLRICLSATCQKNTFIIKVIDHGPGIPADKKDMIFDRFYRVDSARKDREHFGLGLSIAASLTNLMHGTIGIEDTPMGGATFSLKFPI